MCTKFFSICIYVKIALTKKKNFSPTKKLFFVTYIDIRTNNILVNHEKTIF